MRKPLVSLVRRPALSAAVLLGTLAALALESCGTGQGGSSPGSGGAGPGNTGGFSFRVLFPSADSRMVPAMAQSVNITVTDNATQEELATPLVLTPASPTGTIDRLFVGTECRITATAHPNGDGTGTAQAIGYVVQTVVSGPNTSVGISMATTITQVELTPPSAEFWMGQTATLEASAKDLAGNVVLVGDTWQWSSDAEPVATVDGSVDASCAVTGVAEGTAQVAVLEAESGVSQAATVSVNDPTPGAFTLDHTVGAASAGRLLDPEGVALDADGRVFVADTGNDRIRAFSAGGVFERGWACANNPQGIAVGADGNMYVCYGYDDWDGQGAGVQVYNSSGTLVTQWGSYGSANGQLIDPGGLDTDSSGNVYVADTGNHRVQVFTADGAYVRKWGNNGVADGFFESPRDVAIDSDGYVYVCDNTRIQKFTYIGGWLLTWTASYRGAIAFDSSNLLYAPSGWGSTTVDVYSGAGSLVRTVALSEGCLCSDYMGIAVSAGGNIHIASSPRDSVYVYGSDGSLTGSWGGNGTGDAQFIAPSGATQSSTADVYVTDTGNHRIEQFDATGAYVRKWGGWSSSNGYFDGPSGVAVGLGGNVYVADRNNNRVQFFDASGAWLGKWGTPGSGAGEFSFPTGVAVDAAGRILVVDADNLQVFDSLGNYVNGWDGSAGMGAFTAPLGVAVGPDGTVFVADGGNHRVQSFTGDGVFIASWGAMGATEGSFSTPTGVAVDPFGFVYVADSGNNRVQVFRADGTYVTQLDWTQSGCRQPLGVWCSADGNLLFVAGGDGDVQAFAIVR